MIQRDYLVVGAGTAGVSVCEGIRLHDKRGKITLVGNEIHPPYDRVALSKRFLRDKDFDLKSVFRHPAEWYEQQKIDLRLDTMVTQFNLDRRLAVLNNGQTIEFKKACLATGSRPLRPPVAGTNLGNIIYLRSIGDALALKEMAGLEGEIVIVGSGFIGVETAAALRQAKCKVSLMTRDAGLWTQFLDPETTTWLTGQFKSHGVTLHLQESLNGFEGKTVLAQHPDQKWQPLPGGPRAGRAGHRAESGTGAQHAAEQPQGNTGQRISGNRRERHLRRRRHRPVSRPTAGRGAPDRPLGECSSAGPFRRSQHDRQETPALRLPADLSERDCSIIKHAVRRRLSPAGRPRATRWKVRATRSRSSRDISWAIKCARMLLCNRSGRGRARRGEKALRAQYAKA